METLDTARVYARIALLRRRVLVQKALFRALAAGIALFCLLVALGFGTAALYLWLRGLWGAIPALGSVAGLYLLVAAGLAAYALRAPRSAELAALEQMEIEARQKAGAAIRTRVSALVLAERYGNLLMMAFGILGALRRSRQAKRRTDKEK